MKIVLVFSNDIPKPTRDDKGISILDDLSNYVVIDIETTGLDTTYDDIIELAALKVENNTVVGNYNTLINSGYEIPEFIIELTGNTNFLVLGNNDYCKTIKDGKSSKQKKGERLMINGNNIEIISENVFYEMFVSTQKTGCAIAFL